MSEKETYELLNKLSTINHEFHGTHGPYYGLELEVSMPWSSSLSPADVAGDIQRYNDPRVFHCRKERGIGRGFELVFDPCTLRYIDRCFPWDMFWSLRAEYGMTSGDANNCGLHIHFDKSRLTRSEHIKFELFFHRQQQFVEMLSRRRGKHEWQWRGYASLFDFGKTEMQNRVISWRHENTVEVRSFKGSLHGNVIYASVEFIDAVIRFVKQHPAPFINRKHECLEAFLDFAYTNYIDLPLYIEAIKEGHTFKEAA